MNTVFISRKKQFTKSDWRQVFQGENKCDSIQFLIERGFFDSIATEDIQCMAQIFLPEVRNCKLYPLKIDDELYDNKYRMVFPINSELTKRPGTVEIVFTFFNLEVEQRIKTDLFRFEVFPSANGCDMLDNEGTDEFDIIENILKRIEILERAVSDILNDEESPDISDNEEIAESEELSL